MELIVIPRILADILRDAEGLQAKILPLEFAERALEKCREVLTPSQLDLALAYARAAKEFVSKTSDIPPLARAHSNYFAGRDGDNPASERVMWIAAIAVMASCQREMEDAGVIVENPYVPNVALVAEEARKTVGFCAARTRHDQEENGGSDSVQKTQWDEARWQLTHVIATTPFPSDRDSLPE